jgi:hypothetical protein
MSDKSVTLFPSGWLVIALLVAAAIFWAMLLFVTVPHLQYLAGGADPFDVRWMGYSYDDAQNYLVALGPEGRAYYLIPELALDTFFPPLYAASSALALWWLTIPGRVIDGAMPIGWRWALVVLPVAELIFDWGENTAIATMLWTWSDLSPALVRAASLATQLKLVAATLTEISLIVLAVMALLRWRKRKHA